MSHRFASCAAFVFPLLPLLPLVGGCTPSRSTDTTSTTSTTTPLQAAASEPPPVRPSGRTYTKPSKAELAARLTPLQLKVTQEAATEPPFQNAYWNNHAAGIYVDVATGEPLFSSRDKFESGTGWPSFTRPINPASVVEHTDSTLGMARTEVISKTGGSHLGHVFDDGPEPTHMRYCMNSASLRFIPADRLAAEGYGEYATQFGGTAPVVDELPPATSNSCALPPPGKAPGCSATLDVAVFARLEGDDRVVKPAGILEIVRGFEGSEPAVQITFDPTKVTYSTLLAAWTKGREKQSKVFARDTGQKELASSKAMSVSDAVTFRRE